MIEIDPDYVPAPLEHKEVFGITFEQGRQELAIEALEILGQKKKGNYNVIEIDPDYVPAPLEHKEVFGITFEQGRQELAINDELISNIVTENKALTEEAKRDLKVSLIILKYTQSNSVCFVKDGQAICWCWSAVPRTLYTSGRSEGR